MAFMQPEIIKQRWLTIDGPNGSEYIPADLVREPSLGGFGEDLARRVPAQSQLSKQGITHENLSR